MQHHPHRRATNIAAPRDRRAELRLAAPAAAVLDGLPARLARGGLVLIEGGTEAARAALAETVAAAAGLPLRRAAGRYIGETEKNLVLFFDEADALAGRRDAVADAHDRYANAETSYLVQRIAESGGIAILAADRPDPALRRRATAVLTLP